jgi:Flp pilus assembly pilin Flp
MSYQFLCSLLTVNQEMQTIQSIRKLVLEFVRDDRGLSMVEYIVLGALIAILLFGTLRTIFDNMRSRLQTFNSQL